MGVAGSSGKNVANKYKDKGLRVIAVDRDATATDESVKKWKVSGANYPLYTKDNNSFASFYRNISGYPTCHLIKDWKIVATYNAELNESHVKEAFGF